jgi:hypothetical protein
MALDRAVVAVGGLDGLQEPAAAPRPAGTPITHHVTGPPQGEAADRALARTTSRPSTVPMARRNAGNVQSNNTIARLTRSPSRDKRQPSLPSAAPPAVRGDPISRLCHDRRTHARTGRFDGSQGAAT